MSRLLRMDFDGPVREVHVERVVTALRLCRLYPPRYMRLDRTARGWHIVVALLRPLASMGTVAVQAIAGSDWKREAFNFQRARGWRRLPQFWRTRWNVLYHEHHREVGEMDKRRGNPLVAADVRRRSGGIRFVGVRKNRMTEVLDVRRGKGMPVSWIARASGTTIEGVRIYCVRERVKRIKTERHGLLVPFGVGIKLLEHHGAFRVKLGSAYLKARKKPRRRAK